MITVAEEIEALELAADLIATVSGEYQNVIARAYVMLDHSGPDYGRVAAAIWDHVPNAQLLLDRDQKLDAILARIAELRSGS